MNSPYFGRPSRGASARRNVLAGWISEAETSSPSSVMPCDEGVHPLASGLGLVALRHVGTMAPRESEHLRSLALRCRRMANVVADDEMARLFCAMAVDYQRRAARLAIVGK